MVNRQKNILVWIIIWAGLLMMVLYSPIGSPDLYTPKKYFSANQGVQFNGTEIENSPSIKNRYQNSDQEISVPVSYSPEVRNAASYSVSASGNSSDSRPGNTPMQVNNRMSSNPKSGNPEGSSAGITGNMNTFLGKTSKENVNPQNTGFIALTTDLNGLVNNSTPQGVNAYTSGTGATDPGDDDPNGPPIPVGDGWGLFILFGLCYMLFKSRIISKKFFLSHNNKRN